MNTTTEDECVRVARLTIYPGRHNDIFTSSNADVGDIHQQLMLYYRHFFPFKPFFQWLNYDISKLDVCSRRRKA